MEPISSDTPDNELVASLQAGRQEALGILYDRYGRLVYTIALRILNRPDEAEDLTQEIFLLFWKKGQFRPEKATLATYLSVLTRSRALNKLRSQSSQQRSLQRWQRASHTEWAQSCPLESATLQEQQQFVQQALTQLPQTQQQVLVMNYLQGLTQSEISTRLNMPLGTVKTTARQGLRQLRQLLGDAVYGEVP
jgi:RNA polymerase sigma-70 factor (ECF subfamily)